MFKNRPDRNHFIVSIIKSGLRIAAGVALIMSGLIGPGVFLIAAEILGIVEEVV